MKKPAGQDISGCGDVRWTLHPQSVLVSLQATRLHYAQDPKTGVAIHVDAPPGQHPAPHLCRHRNRHHVLLPPAGLNMKKPAGEGGLGSEKKRVFRFVVRDAIHPVAAEV